MKTKPFMGIGNKCEASITNRTQLIFCVFPARSTECRFHFSLFSIVLLRCLSAVSVQNS